MKMNKTGVLQLFFQTGPRLIQSLPLDIEAVDFSGIADQLGEKKSIHPVADRGVNDRIPRSDALSDQLMSKA
jgi:hypothetical protein